LLNHFILIVHNHHSYLVYFPLCCINNRFVLGSHEENSRIYYCLVDTPSSHSYSMNLSLRNCLFIYMNFLVLFLLIPYSIHFYLFLFLNHIIHSSSTATWLFSFPLLSY